MTFWCDTVPTVGWRCRVLLRVTLLELGEVGDTEVEHQTVHTSLPSTPSESNFFVATSRPPIATYKTLHNLLLVEPLCLDLHENRLSSLPGKYPRIPCSEPPSACQTLPHVRGLT